ncbi:hypothetical protein NW754_002893 [Fusarium falciforme]|nr:hypothetical protein NW754_002893 [Fusarium falciforme]
MAKRSISDTLALNNSLKIPQLGFGVYRSPTDVCIQSCLTALECGYRHIDTAQYYGNEKEVGLAVKKSGLDRKDIYLTTKILSLAALSTRATRTARKEMWQALERLYKEGKAKSIGVSNFGIKHIEELKEYAEVWPPHANQIELHPWMQQKEIVEYCEKNGIVVEAYCPLVRNTKADDKTLVGIAEKHGVTPSQVLIQFCLEKKWIPLPKSDNPGRIKANADVFGFDLDDEDMGALNGLDQGRAGAIVQPVDN